MFWIYVDGKPQVASYGFAYETDRDRLFRISLITNRHYEVVIRL